MRLAIGQKTRQTMKIDLKHICLKKVMVGIYIDYEAGTYFATSDDIGLAVESESLDGLIKEIYFAIPVLVQIQAPGQQNPKTVRNTP